MFLSLPVSLYLCRVRFLFFVRKTGGLRGLAGFSGLKTVFFLHISLCVFLLKACTLVRVLTGVLGVEAGATLRVLWLKVQSSRRSVQTGYYTFILTLLLHV